MASIIDIKPLIAVGKTTATNVKPLAAQLRSQAKNNILFQKMAEALEQIQDVHDRLLNAIAASPEINRLSLDSADFRNLIVGGRRGPGELQVLNGGPNYEEIGFIGVRDSGLSWTIATLVDETITTTTPHSLIAGDAVLIDGPTDVDHQGYWEVSAIISPTVFEIDNPPTASGTGGTLHLIWRGGWLKSLSIGGGGFDDAPFFFDPTGQGYIGQIGKLTLLGPGGTERGWIGADFEGALAVSGVANSAGLFRVTVTAHGYDTGDTVYLQDIGGVLDANGEWPIIVINANTFDLEGSTFAGAYTSGGTSKRYWDAAYFRRAFLGGETRDQSPVRVNAAGDVVIDNVGLSSKATFILSENGLLTEVTNAQSGGVPYSLRSTLEADTLQNTYLTYSGVVIKAGGGLKASLGPNGGSGGGYLDLRGSGHNVNLDADLNLLSLDSVIVADGVAKTIDIDSVILLDGANGIVSIDDAAGVLRINGNDVVIDTAPGWSIGGGTANRSFGASFPPSVANLVYLQSDMQQVMDQAQFLSEVLMAALVDLSTHHKLFG